MSKININNYYLHSTGGANGINIGQSRIVTILRSNEIKTNASMGTNEQYLNYADEVCLIDPSKKYSNRNDRRKEQAALLKFALLSPTLVLDREIDVFEPDYADGTLGRKGTTDMFDEVRHKGNISLEHLEFLLFPIFLEKHPFFRFSPNQILEKLNVFKYDISVISQEFSSIPIKDTYTGMDIDFESVVKQINIYQKKLKR